MRFGILLIMLSINFSQNIIFYDKENDTYRLAHRYAGDTIEDVINQITIFLNKIVASVEFL